MKAIMAAHGHPGYGHLTRSLKARWRQLLLLVAVALLMSRTIPFFRTMQGQVDRVNQILREQITGLRVICAFVRDGAEQARFAVANDALTDTALHTGRLMAGMIPMAVAIMQWSTVALVWLAAGRIGAGTLQVRCRYVAGTLQVRCRYVAGTLQVRCRWVLWWLFWPMWHKS
jgi:ABC-type multidrug transport system fused ATPase/permease subunit